MKPIRMMRIPEVLRTFGCGRSSYYNGVKEGLFTTPVHIGPQSVATPDFEIEAIVRARIAGKSDDEIREMVKQLHAQRKEAQ